MADQAATGLFPTADVGSTVQYCGPRTQNAEWIEIEMVGEDGQPVPWLQYEVTLPDGTLVEGYLDDQGFARIEQITSTGTCTVVFPEFDKDVWQLIATDGPKGG